MLFCFKNWKAQLAFISGKQQYFQMTSLRDFIPLQKLGQGSFSTVYKVKRIGDGKQYALKKVRMGALKDRQKENAVNEVRILASLQSPYIIGYKDAMYDEKLNILCIIMEYADGGDLQKRISQAQRQKAFIVERQIWKAVVHVLRGLQTMHAKGVLHRDLKCANIFLSDGFYKLGDLNVSKVNKGRLAYTQTGTPYYASPQVWRDQPYDSKSDIWSFGCIIYEMASLKPPFSGRDMESLYKSVQRGVFDRLPTCFSKDLETVIGLCLQKNPKLRPSTTQLLNNPIIKKYADRLNMSVHQNPAKQEKKELLQTIKVPMGLKGLQNNLPKSKYEQPQKDTSPRHYIQNTAQKQAAIPLRVSDVCLTSPAKPLSPPPSSKKIQDAKALAYARSHEKSTSAKVYHSSQRLIESDNKKNNSYRQQEQIREIQKSLIVKQKQLDEYVTTQLKKRPVTCTPKTQQRTPVKMDYRNEQRQRIRNNVSDNRDVRMSNKKEVDYSVRNIAKILDPSTDNYQSSNKKKVQSVGNVSYKRMQDEISKSILREDINLSRNAYLNKLNINNHIPNKVEIRQYRPDMGKYKYNIMPSWWG